MVVERGGMRRVGRAVLVESPTPLTGYPRSKQIKLPVMAGSWQWSGVG